MVSAILSFILGFVAAALVFAGAAPFLWRRALALGRRVARAELPLSLKEVEADRDFLRARQAVEVCRLQQRLDAERREDYGRRLALDRGREELARLPQLTAVRDQYQRRLAAAEEQAAALTAQIQRLKEEAEARIKLNAADLALFRRQIKQIAAQTAGAIAAEEGPDSPIWRLIAPAGGSAEGNGARPDSLAQAIDKAGQAALKLRAAKDRPAAAELAPAAGRAERPPLKIAAAAAKSAVKKS